ncbi:MAG: cupin domain-containing protein [Lachnospiraceae bacterium]|nr:cupin domain-containing protein [Lachnospiraceae bacterium]
MFYKYDKANSIVVPAPFRRDITPVFMKGDPSHPNCSFSIHLTEWPAGCEIDLHAHPDATEAMYLMSGKGECMINGETHEFLPDTMIVAPPGVDHRIRNTGDELLRVLCVFSPAVSGEDLRARAMAAVEAEENKE